MTPPGPPPPPTRTLPAGKKISGCRYCGRAVTPAAPGAPEPDICADPACRTRQKVEQARRLGAAVADRRATEKDLRAARTHDMLARLSERLAMADGKDPPRIVTPYIDLPIGERSPGEILAFAEHLCRVVGEVFAEPPGGGGEDMTPDIAARERNEVEAPLALNATCIACGGECCTLGLRFHAFVKHKDIAYYRHRNPEATAAEVLADYLARLPRRSVRLSCLYHGPDGCVLPREMRGWTCNDWECGPRYLLRKQIEDTGSTVSAVVALAYDHAEAPKAGAPMARAVTVSDGRVAFHDDLRLPELPATDGRPVPRSN